MSFKKWLIAFISGVLMLFPRLELDGCGPMLYDEAFRVWLFQPNLVNNEALLPFTYTSTLFFQAGKTDDGDAYIALDSTYLKTNVTEWQAECPSAKTVDIHALLYETDPNTYFEKIKSNGLNQNTFVQALKNKPELLAYFNFAKQCEYAFNGGSRPNPDWFEADTIATQTLVPKAEALLKSAKQPFVRLRTAYQLIKAYEYLDNTEGVKKIFDAHIKSSKSTSWIVGSALFYYAKAQPEGVARNLWATNCYEKTQDKKFQSLKLINREKRTETVAEACDDKQRALAATLMTLQYPGRSLDEIQAVYTANPTQSELPMLIEREINKLEDWLYTYELTSARTNLHESVHRLANGTSFEALDYSSKDYAQKEAAQQAANWQSDRIYLNNVAGFVDKLISENKVKDREFMLLSGAHLAFLTQNFEKTRTYLATLKTLPNVPANVRVQADLTRVLCDLYAAPTISAEVEASIAQFETTLQKEKKVITDFETFRQQVYLFIGKKFIAQGKVGRGCLLTMMSERFTKYVSAFAHENGYHRLFGLAKPADFDDVLQIINTPKTAFERFLAAEKRPYLTEEGHYDEKTDEWVVIKSPRQWDVNKIKDYKASYYVRHDQMDNALAVFKTIPLTYWQEEPYSTMLNCNPFYIDLAHPHATIFADSTKYNKTTFTQRVVALQNEAKRDPSVSAKNYYLLGNAYFNISWKGNFWLMSDISWGTSESYSEYFTEDNTFANNYFGLERAQKYYELCLKTTNDVKLAALCHFMIGYCSETRTDYNFYKGNENRWDPNAPKPPDFDNPYNGVFESKFPNSLAIYGGRDYWCTHYENLAKLYSGF